MIQAFRVAAIALLVFFGMTALHAQPSEDSLQKAALCYFETNWFADKIQNLLGRPHPFIISESVREFLPGSFPEVRFYNVGYSSLSDTRSTRLCVEAGTGSVLIPVEWWLNRLIAQSGRHLSLLDRVYLYCFLFYDDFELTDPARYPAVLQRNSLVGKQTNIKKILQIDDESYKELPRYSKYISRSGNDTIYIGLRPLARGTSKTFMVGFVFDKDQQIIAHFEQKL
jgi:hypothetical protein